MQIEDVKFINFTARTADLLKELSEIEEEINKFLNKNSLLLILNDNFKSVHIMWDGEKICTLNVYGENPPLFEYIKKVVYMIYSYKQKHKTPEVIPVISVINDDELKGSIQDVINESPVDSSAVENVIIIPKSSPKGPILDPNTIHHAFLHEKDMFNPNFIPELNRYCNQFIPKAKLYFSKRINDNMHRLGYSIEQYEELTEIPKAKIYNWRRKVNIHLPKLDLLQKLVNNSDVSIDYMLGFTNLVKYSEISSKVICITDRLQEIRSYYNLNLMQFCALINKEITRVSRWRRVSHNIRFETLVELAIRLDVSADYLIGRTDVIRHLSLPHITKLHEVII